MNPYMNKVGCSCLSRASRRLVCLAIFLVAFCRPLHAGVLNALNIDQTNYTAAYSGNVPCSEYGHAAISVTQDPGVAQYLQVSASFNGSPAAWLIRNVAVPDFISNASTTVDLTQLGIFRGVCVAGMPLLYGAMFTDTPIDTAPIIDFTGTVQFGTRDDRAEGGIPDGDFAAGNLPPGGPPPPFVFIGGQTEQISRAGMGSVIQGLNECGPGGATNSLHWLNDQGSIDLGGDTPDQSLQKLKADMIPSGWRGNGVTGGEFVSGKLRFAQRAEHILNIDVHYQSDSSQTTMGASITVNNMTASRDGAAGPPTVAYLKQQMELGQDVELKLDWLDPMGNRTGGHFVTVSGFSMAGNQNALWFNDDALQDGTANGLRINHFAKIESEGNFMKLGGLARNRVVAVIAESPRTTFTVGYVFNLIANTISGFVENPLGQLNPLGGFPMQGQGGPRSGAYSPQSNTLYVGDYFGNNVTSYGVDGTGSLALRQTIMAGTDPTAMAIMNRGGQEYLFAANEGSNDVYEYMVASDGILALLRQVPLRGASFPQSMAATKDNQFLYIASCGNPSCNGPGTVNILKVEIDGNVTENSNSPVLVGQGAVWVALDAAGRRLFTANQASGTITELDRNGTTGDLTMHATMSVAPGVSSIAFDPRDQVAVVTVGPPNYCIVSEYDGATGNLVQVSTFTTGMFPIAGTFDPGGVNYYQTNVQGGSIGGVTVNLITGNVTPTPGSPTPTGPGAFNSIFIQLPGSPPQQPAP